jgi:hypothetical protein
MLKLKTVELIGPNHKYHLELVLFPNEHTVNGQKQICLQLNSVHKIHAINRRLLLPLHALPWLRKQMTQMLAKYDGTEEIKKKASLQIPQKFFHMSMLY